MYNLIFKYLLTFSKLFKLLNWSFLATKSFYKLLSIFFLPRGVVDKRYAL